jgi:hypothetical protein
VIHSAAPHIQAANHHLQLAIEALRWARLTTDHSDVAELLDELEEACAKCRRKATELRVLKEAS